MVGVFYVNWCGGYIVRGGRGNCGEEWGVYACRSEGYMLIGGWDLVLIGVGGIF